MAQHIGIEDTEINTPETGGWFAVGSTVYLRTDTAPESDDGFHRADLAATALLLSVGLFSSLYPPTTPVALPCPLVRTFRNSVVVECSS